MTAVRAALKASACFLGVFLLQLILSLAHLISSGWVAMAGLIITTLIASWWGSADAVGWRQGAWHGWVAMLIASALNRAVMIFALVAATDGSVGMAARLAVVMLIPMLFTGIFTALVGAIIGAIRGYSNEP